MKKFLTIAAILLVVGFVVAKNRQMCSYVCTTSKMLTKHLKGSVSPEFEIERLKGEIASLEADVDRMIREEANLSVDLRDSKTDLGKKEAAVVKTREGLKAFAEKVKANPDKGFVFTNTSYTPVVASSKLKADYDLFKSQEKSVESLRNLISTKEKQLNTFKTQRDQIKTMKQTFEAQLDQLAADWITLKNESPSANVSFDTSRIAMIEEGLKNLKHKVDVETEYDRLKNSQQSSKSTPPAATNQIDPDTVLNAIEQSTGDKSTVKTPAPVQD